MKRYIYSIALAMTATAAMAQETYESAAIATNDLNGTAKYIGMGGAMEALGADISTMSTNPAGTGLFRKSWIGLSAGVTTQQGDKTGVAKDGVTNADFNQIGFIYSQELNNSYVNLGFNYHKSRNFNQILSAVNSLNNASLNKFAANKYNAFGEGAAKYSDELLLVTYNGNITEKDAEYFDYVNANRFSASQEIEGYNGEYDFNISGNINNRIFLGLTVGIRDVHYQHYNTYAENLVNYDYYSLLDERSITGTGYDVKFGAIIRPIEESPFRIGLYASTPTWYELLCEYRMYAQADMPSVGMSDAAPGKYESKSYEYEVVTPWKFGVSLGHTIGSTIALGATYEYSDYSSINNKALTGSSYDYYYDSYDNHYTAERQMNDNTSMALKGVHLLKVGGEFKPVPEMAIRLGYNYQSAIYKPSGQKSWNVASNYDNNLISDGNYATTSEFINWGDTHRITCGLGFAVSDHINLDLSYQYITQKGDFHSFEDTESYDDKGNVIDTNIANVTKVSNNRHQANLSISYRF